MPDTIDADSLINSAIEARSQREARLQNIDAQSQAIGQQLRSTNRRDRGRITELQSQQRGLEQARTGIREEQHSDDAMTNLRVQSQFRNAHLATKALDDQRHEETARQTANIANGIARLEAKYPNRGYDATQSDKFQAEAEQLGSQNEMGARSQAGRQALFHAAQFQDQVRQKTLANAASKLATLTKGGLSPEEFANRDHAKDFTTNAADLASAQSQDINVSKRPKPGEPIGANTVFQAGGANWMLPTTSFSHFDSNFKLQPTAQSALIEQPLTPDQQAQAAGFRSAQQAQGYREGNPLLDYAPSGTATTERSLPMSSGPTPSGGFASAVKIQPQVPVNDNQAATLPAGVQPNQPLQPVTQLGTQSMANAPQVVQQPAAQQPPAPQVATIGSQADYDALEPGSTFIHNGQQYTKPKPQAESQ